MITYKVTLKNYKHTATKTVTMDADTALEAMGKAKSECPAYTEVLACKIDKVNF